MPFSERSRACASCLGLVAVVAAVFGRAAGHQFVNYDDQSYILENPHVLAGISIDGVKWAFTHIHSQNWHPLTTLTHMLDCSLYGINPAGPHAENVALHAIASALLVLVLRAMTGAVWRSAFVAALFAIHPLRVESVAWVSERKDVLSALFFMLTLGAYAWYARSRAAGRMVLVALFLALGLMAKPMLVTTPLVLLLLDIWPLNRISFDRLFASSRRPILEKLPLFVISAASCAATISAQRIAIGTTVYLPLRWRLNGTIDSYVQYLKQLVWPVDLVPFYPHVEGSIATWWLALEAALLVAITLAVFLTRRSRPYQLVGWLWYLITLLPVIGIVQVGLQGHADRYTYLPHIGLLLGATWSIADAMRAFAWRKIILIPSAAAAIVALAILSWRQTGVWRDTETLWRHTLAIDPNNDVAHAGLGGILVAQGQVAAGIAHYDRALEIRPGNAAAENGLAVAYTVQNRPQDAIEHWKKMLEVLPDNVDAHVSLGLLYAGQVRIREALAEWELALRYDETNAAAANNIAWVLATSPDPALRDGTRAIELAQIAVRSTNGKSVLQLQALAAAYAEAGKFEEALATVERIRQLAPELGEQDKLVDLDAWAAKFRSGVAIRDRR